MGTATKSKFYPGDYVSWEEAIWMGPEECHERWLEVVTSEPEGKLAEELWSLSLQNLRAVRDEWQASEPELCGALRRQAWAERLVGFDA